MVSVFLFRFLKFRVLLFCSALISMNDVSTINTIRSDVLDIDEHFFKVTNRYAWKASLSFKGSWMVTILLISSSDLFRT